ncbi:hypothetical protein M378DRAFT_916511 [Amanita muscaria Koide BX008]|uniref:Nephrocystin 3-like N-terminal domain-containing protein n=1 Tax=Amanita muscaria (strain Koide BX008) TaxID=946122 RepID=A0A0C2T269_AMAMK|nr:hypothetical protein M378DRAFT_916511 [Amanita muscaria Koide BX008]
MLSPTPWDSQQPLHISQLTNNQKNKGIVGNGSSNIVNFGNNNRFSIPQAEEDQLDSLLNGYISKDALYDSFDSSPEFHPDTRKTVRNEIVEWFDESGSKKSPLLWLNGPVGVGKSAIARIIAASHDKLVVATFFFSASSDRSASTLLPTLAWQLGRAIPETRKHIIAALKNSGSLQTTQIEKQFDLLIIEPLKSIATFGSRPVIVIDGVDECIDESLLVRFLRVLVRAGEDGRMAVRFIICSRPEPRIRAILGNAHHVNPTANRQELQSHSLLHRVKHLVLPTFQVYHSRCHDQMQRSGFTKFPQDVWELYRPIRHGVDKDISSSFDTCDDFADTLNEICHHPVTSTIQIGFSEECKEDIARYLEDKFNAIHHPGGDTSPWFQRRDVLYLVKASCGQFLYASTIVRLIHESHFDPRDVFEMARRGSLPTPDLNELYRAILKRAQDTIRKHAEEGGPDYQTEWRIVTDTLALLVFLAGNVHFFTVPKSFPVIEGLLGLENVHHRSFLEFLQSQKRSGEYYISYSTALRRILILMGRTGVRYNIFQMTVGGFIFKIWPLHVIVIFLNGLDFQTF